MSDHTSTPRISARRRAALSLLLAATALPFTPASPLLAQEATQTDVAQPDEAMGDIIVTARRRGEAMQDVPVAISAFSAESLDNRGAGDITVLQQAVPNLTLQIARGSNSTLIAFIRGVGQQDPLWGFEPGVGLYVDDVYIARPQGAVLDIFDIERIEVLRGPQGTLYGRNTIGGAIKYVTRRLGDEPSVKAKLTYGTFNQIDGVLSVSAPIGDKVAVGGAVALYKRDGFGTNLTTGREHYNKDVLAGRISAEFRPTESFSLRIAADRTDDDSNARHGSRLAPGTVAGSEVLGSVYDTRAGLGDDNWVMNQGVSATAEWVVNDQVTLKSITAYREGKTDTNIDFDNTASPTLDVPAFYRDKQFSQEAQILYTGDRLQAVAGLYYMDAKASGAFDTILGGLGITIATAGEVDTKSFAAFADVSYDITEQFAVSVGGRYTRDKKEGTVFRANYLGLRSPLLGRQNATLLLVRTDYTNERTFDEFTPRVSLTYKPTDDLTVYASYGKGFKSGGFDMRGDAVFTPNTVNGYDPEKVEAWELGIKGSAYDNRLSFNFAGFYSDYSGQQVTTQVAATNGIASFVDNVGSSRIWGLELEGRIVLTDNLSLSGAVGYTNGKFKEFLTYDLATQTFIDVASQRVFQNTPKWNGNVNLTYTRDLGSDSGALTVNTGLSFRSKMSLFEVPSAILDQPRFALLDATVRWTSPTGQWAFAVTGKNLTDKEYRVGGYNFPGATFGNSIIGFYGPPRTVAATLEFKM